ncbi:MAG: ABC transporter ATP-binding protein [Coriobacteriia bacterium]
MGIPVVETHALTKRYKSRAVVDSIDLRVDRGEIYGFLGLNGAGKTTTIRMLMGLIRPSEGAISLFSQPVPAERLKVMRRVGSLVESPSYYGHLSGWDNLRVLAIMLDVSDSRIAEVLEIVGLSAEPKKRVKDYSLGMKQRLGIAAALLGSPELLVLDEPTNGLDPAGIHEVRELIRRMPREHGITVLVSSHLLAEVEQMATSVGVIHEGKLIFQGPIASLRAHSHGHVRVEVDRPAEALALLNGQARQVRLAEDCLRLESLLAEDAAHLVRTLVEGGISVYRVEERQLSLEETFLALTAEASHP